jgi:hypothetical protein
MNDKLQEAINALRAAGNEEGAKAVEELRAELTRTMDAYRAPVGTIGGSLTPDDDEPTTSLEEAYAEGRKDEAETRGRPLSDADIAVAFYEAFPGHEVHQESIDFARSVEQRVLSRLEPMLADALEVAQMAWEASPKDKDQTQGLAFNLRNKLRDYFGM